MKIDDHISLCRDMSKDLRDMAKRTNNAHIKEDADEWDEMADMFEELKWYRRQDLIKREDVLNCRPEWLNENMEDAIKSTHNKGWNECNLEWYDTIKQIPNAEPPIGECTPNCEKSITCKHCIQGTYCNSSTGKEEESPCCWESKEEGWRNA